MKEKLHFGKSFAIKAILITAILISGLPNLVLAAKEVVNQEYHNQLSGSGKTGIKVETTNGEISVSGYDGEEVIIDGQLSVSGKKHDVCEELMKEIKTHLPPQESQTVICILFL